MIIINKNLSRLDTFRPESMNLNIEERKSSATMTLGPSAPTLNVGDWLLDDEEPGAGIVWRVRSVDTQYNTNTRTVSLEHIINTLKDSVIFGEVKTSDIAGNSATNCTALQAARKALSYQNVWTLGEFDYNVSNPYSFNGDTVFAALETVTSSLEDACWTYDLTLVPFRINIKRIPNTVASEMRMDRNIQTLKRTVDRSRMYTRIYPIGKNNLHISGDYVNKNESIYGTIAVVETDQSKGTDAELRQWATEKLNRHCEPSVTVQIAGLELSAATGEPLDHFQINTKCRVPLPEFNTVITEKVTKLSWSDKMREPEKVTITLANLLEDVASIVNSANNSAGRGARAGAKQAEEDHAWFVDTTDHVAMVAEAVAGEGASKDWSRVSSIVVDGEGIHQRVTKTEDRVTTAETKIDANEYAITLEASRAKSKEEQLDGDVVSLNGRISVEAGKITQIVSAVGSNGEVTAASIVLAINNTGESEAHIDAQKVYIGNTKSTTVIAGKCSLSDVTADVIQSRVSSMGALNANALVINGNGGFISVNGTVTASGFSLAKGGAGPTSYSNIGNAVNELQIVPVTGQTDTYVLQKKSFTDGDWVDVGTFDHATSTTLAGSWGSNTYTVTASPQAISISVTPKVHIQTGTTATIHAKIGEMKSGSWTDHDGDEYAYLVKSGATVYLKKENSTGGSGNLTYGQITVDAPTVSGAWSSNTWTATSTYGGSASISPQVHIATGSTATMTAKVGIMSSGSWTDHDGTATAYLVKSGATVYLNKNNAVGGSGNVTYAQTTVDSAVVSGTWSGNTWTATSTLGGSASISPRVHLITGTSATLTANVGIMSGGSWTDHSGTAYGYLVKSGLNVYLRSQNAVTGGETYAQIAVDDPYPNTITMTQKSNASGSKQFTAYYLNGSTYVSMGQAYWYSSSKNLNVSSKKLRY